VVANSEYRYTLDERTLRNVEALSHWRAAGNPERQRFAALLAEIDDVSLLVFALLFQEMGSGAADRARAAAVRMEMPADARETVEFQIVPPRTFRTP
jgi:UTP:GlnB (protein PII) uridylyltransferase